jgi:hypothetical protein
VWCNWPVDVDSGRCAYLLLRALSTLYSSASSVQSSQLDSALFKIPGELKNQASHLCTK